ncbi:TonB-dependent receptor domain-containing protein [Undibacterium sp. Di24W]|uniref:TonB-dependent receptor domain-containing protein n=1 Tax=Undibacterium sp. Di24W TaxID=3413033 RepID=UPI003BF14709
MIVEKILSRSLRLMFTGSVVASMGVMALPAVAQEKKMETVVVTGTRITSPGTTSNSPIGSISAEEIKSAQPVAVEEFFKGLPAAVPAIGPGTNNGTGGAATIDLRGLGSNRTLVLVNGRRLVPYDLGGTVDTNSIPIALLSRVDLVTGGASVVYGADAVSGVANFNLKKNFQGFEVNTSYGSTSKSDAKRNRTDVTMGASLDEGRGNVVLSLGRTKTDPLTQGTRAYGKSALNSISGAPDGSGTTVPAAMSTVKGTGGTDTLAGAWQIDPATGKLVQPVSLYNFNPLNYYVTGLDRSQATSLANYKINDNFEVYGELFYTASKVASTLAESGTFNNTFNVPIGNPFIPAAARDQLCQRRGIAAADCVVGNTTIVPLTIGRRITEMGPRFNDFDNKTLQYTIGTKGEIAGSWNYDAYWSRGTADQTQIRKNWGSLSKVKQALNSVAVGKCVDASNGCVPLNVWGAAGSITPEQVAYINQSAILLQGVEQDVGAISTSGDLGNIKSPWAKDPISVSVSAEQRKLTAYTRSDAVSQIQGEVLGTGAPTPDRTGSFKLKEYAVEAAIPLIKDLPFIRSLNAEIGYRQTNFATAKKSQDYGSYKYGGEWTPVQMLRFRGMVQKATRAPNVNELFAPAVTGLSNLATDPCQLDLINAGQANTAGTLSNLCRLTGVPTSVIGSLDKPSAGQINRQTGGNPNLGPEEAKTKTIGFVIEPLPKLAISLDYYKIDITKAISSPTTTDVLDGCYSPKFNPGYTLNASCALIGRSAANGSFNGVDSKGVITGSSNLGTQSTAGYDLSVKYQVPMTTLGLDSKYGRLDLGFDLNKTTSYHAQPTPASIDRDCLGYYSVACGGPTYKNKFTQRTAWTFGEFVFGYNWRHVSGVIEEPGGTNFLPAYAKIDAFDYVDLSAVWNFNKNIRFNISINNAANKTPPIVGSTIGSTGTNSGNTFPQYYDAVGRYFSVGATIKF